MSASGLARGETPMRNPGACAAQSKRMQGACEEMGSMRARHGGSGMSGSGAQHLAGISTWGLAGYYGVSLPHMCTNGDLLSAWRRWSAELYREGGGKRVRHKLVPPLQGRAVLGRETGRSAGGEVAHGSEQQRVGRGGGSGAFHESLPPAASLGRRGAPPLTGCLPARQHPPAPPAARHSG